jgi:hypothetical protein
MGSFGLINPLYGRSNKYALTLLLFATLTKLYISNSTQIQIQIQIKTVSDNESESESESDSVTPLSIF